MYVCVCIDKEKHIDMDGWRGKVRISVTSHSRFP